MTPTYDVIVVGAGNGGLACAARSAQAGLKTLVLEKHNIPGGCATTFVRGRFEFEASLHELCDGGTDELPGAVNRIFYDLGAPVDWRCEHTLFRTVCDGPEGYDVRLQAKGATAQERRESVCQSLEEAAPGSLEPAREMFRLADRCAQAVAYITKMKGKPNPLVMATAHADFMRCASHSVDEVFVALGFSAKARHILSTYWGYLGVPTDDLNAFHYINMIDGYTKYGPTMPAQKSHELSEALASVIYAHGGDIFYNTRVDGFVYDDDGAVVGVTANGTEYRARRVVSNVIANDVWNLSPAVRVPDHARQLANARDLGISVFTIYVGLDCTAQELGVSDYTVFLQRTPDAREQYDRRANKGFYIVNCLNCVVPEATPEGTCSLFFTAQLDGADVPSDLSASEYKQWKNDLAKSYIRDYEARMGVSVLDHIEEVEVATPVTFARYLGSPDGTIYGYRSAGWDNIMVRTASQATDNVVPHLSFVGGSSIRGDGYSCSYITGVDAGARLARELGTSPAEPAGAAKGAPSATSARKAGE